MNDSTLNQLNESDLDYSSESYQADGSRCVMDEQFVPKVGMIFKTLEEVGKFYKNYSKLAGFSTKIRNTTRKGDKIKNQLIVCSSEGKWKSNISPTLKTNPSAGINCLAKIYVHILKDVGLWTIFKVVLNDSHLCSPDRAEMLKQHRELSDHSIKNAFWADARSRAACKYFGDVVSFDTMYNINRYNLVFGSFVSVNHHGQLILLGCTLMKNEDIKSFKWLFE
ncbi:hypothetical protein AHAS_Ahas17G0237300 [Arachis hypogaea]